MDFINELKDNYSVLTVNMCDKLEKSVDDNNSKSNKKPLYKYVAPIAIPLVLTPTIAFASPFDSLHNEFLKLADVFALAIFSFAGASWMFGHRSKGLEMMICGMVGYLIVRYAADIRDYLKLWTEGGL